MTQARSQRAAARAAAADRPRRRRDDPRDPSGHPVLDGRADRRGPHRHVGPGPAPRSPTAPGGPGTRPRPWRASGPIPPWRAPARHRTGVRRPHHHGADRRHPSARRRTDRARRSPPRPAGAGLRARQRRAAVRPEHQRRADQPAAGAGGHRCRCHRQSPRPGQPPNIINRAQWGADESMRCGNPQYDNGIRAGIVHHTAGSNDYAPEDSAGIVRSIYEYHTRTLGWCDIAYNALVDKYGQVFEGRAGGIDKPVEGAHTGGFNRDTWGVAMLGNFDHVAADARFSCGPPAGLLGWRLGPGPRRPQGHRRAGLGRRLVLQVPVRRDRRRCRRSSPTATSASPTARATRRTRRWTRSAISRHDSTTRQGRGSGRHAARRRDLRALGVDGRHEQPPRRADVTGGLGRRAGPVRRPSSGARSTGRRQAGPNPSPARSTRRGDRWASSAARWACRPAAKSRSRNGSCRTSSTAR